MKIIEGQKTVPMIQCFILFITTSVLIKITCFQKFLKAKMLNHDPYIIFKLLHNLFDLSQVSLSKMAKH
jgi:hypothetical protein